MNNTFADFFKNLKTSLDNSVKNENSLSSDVDILEYLLDPLITARDIRNKNGDFLYLDKSRVSRILTNKDNLPVVITDEYSFLKTNKDIKNKYITLFKKDISNSQIDELLKLLNVTECNGNPYETLYFIFIERLCNKNILDDEHSIVIWQNGCNSLRLVSGNIFDYCFRKRSQNEIITIPVNTTFNTHVSTKMENIKPLVSSETLHGKWIQRCKSAGITEDDIKEKVNLFLDSYCEIDSKTKEYPVGTIVPFNTSNGSSYLMVLAGFDNNNVAHSNRDELKKAIKKLIEFYDFNGQGYPLFIPLLGTGRSRIGLSYKESFELIKNTLLEEKNHIQGSVNIIALPEAFEKIIKEGSNVK